MNMPFSPSLPLPGDADRVATALAANGGIPAVPPAEFPHFLRAVQGLDLMPLVHLAEAAGPGDAALLYDLWLSANGAAPAACAAWFNLGVLRMRLGDPGSAITAYRKALALKPDLAEAAVNLGTALEAAGDAEAALAAWRAALPAPALRQILHNQLGRVLETQGRIGPAAVELRASLLITPEQPDVQQHLIHARQRMTAWPAEVLAVPGLTDAAAARNCGPLAALALFDDPLEQAAAAALWIARKVPLPGGPLAPSGGYRHDRIRIGYLSTDFCRHAMSFLIAELLERHDRSRFQVWGYDASPEDGSDIRARVLAALDRHVPIHGLTDAEAAARIRADEIDILIDLNGLTKGARLEILRWKPAPMQATYLGYIGPVPLPELDYILCDAVTIPPKEEAAYHPRPLRIEGCYQANDSTPPALPAVSRVAEGLPEGAFVFTCVSHHYKLTPAMWDSWCRIVAAVPDSVLWLIDDNPESRTTLAARWAEAGLAPERLVFAPRVDPDRYRARLALADLFLDTSPYNAGTIASDALRMGLPLVTLQGRAFSARMASSLLAAVGLPEGIATSPADYESRAVRIATDPALHARLKAHLAGGAWSRTLGDSAGFARRFEAALERGLAGLQPVQPG
ncbi:tetratricopeptide repeat protein [Rhodobacter sp. Har01]|uniref:O-linked N-acetylglucosamine transferase, SPINDLY family protein n=1 Tax=Rhodobacter sp. Har01 TaxID=2883999 RepID=UPI001D09294C|nr:tetratricopeptide repeat protein [Rhodobacter sp. Har01]MCB6177856.1 tetratricopeptide repeat protein [Rhodobacter sp. Har01]